MRTVSKPVDDGKDESQFRDWPGADGLGGGGGTKPRRPLAFRHIQDPTIRKIILYRSIPFRELGELGADCALYLIETRAKLNHDTPPSVKPWSQTET